MTKLEIPSIVVQSGNKGMERTVRTQRSLSKQDEIDEEFISVGCEENQNGSESTCSEEPSPSTTSNNNGNSSNTNQTLHRSRSQNKVKLLVRSHAVREETSPPPDPESNCCSPELVVTTTESSSGATHQNAASQSQTSQSTNNGNSSASNRRHKLRREGSSQENWENPPLSRGNSREQYDGIDLHQFIVETLNKNHKDRALLLKIESELVALTKDPKRTVHKFAQMSSYQRMLVHRVAAYFSMEHNVDTSGVSVIVNTTKTTKLPESRFREFIRDDLLLPEEPRRSILKRDSSSFDETGSFKSGDRMLSGDSRRSKSFEEREEEYEKARRRIFNREHSQRDDVDCMDDLHWEQDEGVCTQYDHTNNNRNPPRLLKVESYESGDTLRANSLRLSVVSKSHSFNGYEPQQQARILTKQDSGSSMSSRISPSSSGYKSQRSDATLSATPSPTATPNLHTQLSGQSGGALSPEPETVIWAVTDLASVPPGSMLIHPQTGQPYTNADGSIYHYDPSNPPRVIHNDGQSLNSVNGHVSQQKHHSEVMDGSCVLTSQQAGPGHEVGKTTIDSGYDSGGSTSYLAPPPPYQGSGPPSALTASYAPQAPMMSSCGEAQSYNHVVYPMPTNQTHQVAPYHHQYDPRVQDGNDLSGYMMGLSIDASRPPDSRQVMYWQTHHVQSHGAMPVYYNAGNQAPPSSAASTHRYHAAGPPVSASACPPQTAFVPAPPQPPPAPAALPASAGPQHPQHITPEHANCAYGTAYSSGPECISYAPSVHMYYTQPYNGNGSGAGSAFPSNSVPSGGNPSYFNNSVPNCSAPIMALQYQQPCAHPTPPHTPQSMCSQFAFYNGCYPTAHYAQPNASLPVPQLFRKPLGPRCVSPMRPPYPMSPTVKERQSDDKMQPVPVYGFRVLPGDMRLIGNAGRLPFAVPTSKPTHPRRHRTKITHSNRAGGPPSFDVSSLHTASKV